MLMRVAGANANEDRRQSDGSFLSRVSLAVLVLLLWLASVPAWASRETGRVARQEAPFPTIFDLETPNLDVPVQYEVLRGDFHMHTIHSDGKLTPADRVIESWQCGYDVIAITDHGNFRAYEEALPTANALGILLLRGMETGISGKEHLVAFDFSADYQPRNPHGWSETPGQSPVFYQDQLRRLAEAGAFVLYAHPHVGLREPVLWGIDQGWIQGIEVKNDVVGSGWNTAYSLGTYWYPFGFDWAVEYNLTIFANTDVHGARDNPPATTLILAEDRSREAVMEAFRAGRTIAYFNDMFCGHEWVLKLLMGSLVDIRTAEVENGTLYLRMRNRGPVELTAEIAGMPVAPVILGPYQEVLVGVRRVPDIMTIAWRNLYIRSTQNLTTTHAFTGTTPPSQSAR